MLVLAAPDAETIRQAFLAVFVPSPFGLVIVENIGTYGLSRLDEGGRSYFGETAETAPIVG